MLRRAHGRLTTLLGTALLGHARTSDDPLTQLLGTDGAVALLCAAYEARPDLIGDTTRRDLDELGVRLRDRE